MNVQRADGEKQGFIYQGKFSENLDFQTLHDKINNHLSFIRAQKEEADNAPEKREVEKATIYERN